MSLFLNGPILYENPSDSFQTAFRMGLINKIFQILWFILCIIRLDTIFGAYMRYKTVSNTVSYYPDPFNTYGLELCFKYSNVLDDSAIKKKYPNEKFDSSHIDHVTGIDIFNFTPTIQQIFNQCKVRIDSNYLTSLNQSQCNEHFEIGKYFICLLRFG